MHDASLLMPIIGCAIKVRSDKTKNGNDACAESVYI